MNGHVPVQGLPECGLGCVAGGAPGWTPVKTVLGAWGVGQRYTPGHSWIGTGQIPAGGAVAGIKLHF